MKISGFTMVRNATKLYFPIKEAIQSILPMVDEFIVALDKGDSDDKTEEEIRAINSPKIRIIYRTWNPELFKNSQIYAHETNVAMSECTGDWCFYIQGDEAVHENDLAYIKKACETYLDDKNVDGFLFQYYHFWGDYNHYLPFHGWYRNEIRIVRNKSGIYSIKDAQSFRKGSDEKLRVIELDAHVYHYGWVRPPMLMHKKKNTNDAIHAGKSNLEITDEIFTYGNMSKIPVFKNAHPQVMEKRIQQLDWQENLKVIPRKLNRKKFKHEKLKYRLISFFENHLLGGKQWFGYDNWDYVGKFKRE